MKFFFIILFFFLTHSYICNAQSQKTASDSNKIEKLKREYLTNQLELSPTESRAFWPMYRNYNTEIKLMWKECGANRALFREKVATIRDKYRPIFVQILHSHVRANNVFKAERDYRQMLNNELEQRKKN